MPEGSFRPAPLAVFAVALLTALGPARAGVPSLPPTSAPAEAGERPELAGRRIVKHFDFNEAPLGNYEDLPMHWQRHGGDGFSPLLEGSFDRQVGHISAPCFRLQINGGSLGYHYVGRDIAVRTSSDYLLVAFVRTQGLSTARAYITAYYLDRKGQLIPGTERRSSLIGGDDWTTEWEPISIGLPGNVPGSRYIGLSLWLTQAAVWDTEQRPKRSIERIDVDGSAWFDDLTVYRLPRVLLRSASMGNVFSEGQPVELRTEVNDPDGLHLAAELRLLDATGKLLDRRSVPIHTGTDAGHDSFRFDSLPVGLYGAELVVTTGSTVLSRRSLRVALLAESIAPPAALGRGFGVILNRLEPALLAGQSELLRQIRPEFVKLPVWRAQPALLGTPLDQHALDAYLESIVQSRSEPIGVLIDEARYYRRSDGAGIPSMIDILNEAPQAWKPFIAGTWSRYSGLVQVWQLGADGDRDVLLDHRLPRVLASLYREMKPLMSQPLLATTGSAHFDPAFVSRADYEAILLPCTVPLEDIGRHLQPFMGQDRRRVWVTVEALPDGLYDRELRLADLARRLAETSHQGVGGVFVAAPWDGQSGSTETQVSPTEDYLILRTLADVLGDSRPVSSTTLDGRVECRVFDRNGMAIQCVWDRLAPPEGLDHVLLLGEGAWQVDIWGRRRPLRTVGGQQVVRVGPMPTFIVGTPTWLVEFRRHFAVDPQVFEASFDARQRDIVFVNTHREPISGLVRLVAPRDWDIRPSKIPFLLEPGQTFRHSVSIHFPANAEAGVTPIVGEFDIDAERRYRLTVPAWFELGLDSVDLETFVFRQAGRVVVRVAMTNRSAGQVSFDGTLLAPGRAPISRLFASFQSGQSITKDFLLPDEGRELAGVRARVSLKEVQGTRIWNRLVTLP